MKSWEYLGVAMLRIFGLGAFMIAIAIAIYLYSRDAQNLASSSPGGTLTSQAEVTGVRTDLLSIANAERSAMASEGKYLSLDDLVSGHYITMHGSRPPYTYDIETSSTGFRAVATRSDSGKPAQIWVDETMTVQSSENHSP